MIKTPTPQRFSRSKGTSRSNRLRICVTRRDPASIIGTILLERCDILKAAGVPHSRIPAATRCRDDFWDSVNDPDHDAASDHLPSVRDHN